MEPSSPQDQEVERLLAASRPLPDQRWRAELGRSLLPLPATRQRRPWLLGAAAAGALAAAALAASLAGLEPFARDDDAAKGDRRCVFVNETRTERVPVLIRDSDGERIEYRAKPVTGRVRRCR